MNTAHEEINPRLELNQARSTIEKMRRLVDNNDYKFLLSILQEQFDIRMHQVLVRPNGIDDVQKSVYDHGEIAGLKIALNFASILLSGAEETAVSLAYLDSETENETEVEWEK